MFLEKFTNDTEKEKYSKFINKELVSNLKKYSRIIAYFLIFCCIVILLINEENFSGLLSNLKTVSFNNVFNLLVLISFVLFSSQDKHLKKYSKIIFYLVLICTAISILNLFDIFNLSYFIPIYEFGIIKFVLISFVLYSTIYKRYYKFSQVLAIAVMLIGFFGFFYYLHLDTLDLVLAIIYLLYFVMLPSIFLTYSSDEGLFRSLCLTTTGSILARRILTLTTIFLMVLSFVLMILHSFTQLVNETWSKLILSIGSVVFLLITMYYYANKMNYSDYQILKSRKESQKREILFEDIIQYTVEGILVIDKEDKITYANQVFFDLLNQDKNIIGKNYHLLINDRMDKGITECKETLQPKFYDRSININNKEMLFNGWIIPFIKNEEFNGIIITGLDVTESSERQSALKKSIDEKNILLTEVHHRVKNNMQIIISLLNLQSHKIHDENAKTAILNTQTRVRSMALVHENLYKNFDFADMNINEYINDLVLEVKGTYLTSNNITFKTDVIKAFINIDIAVSLGLILNELITNCIKYAFPDGQEGIISINLFKENELFVLVVEDNGVGADTSESKGTGIGSTLISSLVTQIDGTYKMESLNGTKVTITFKNQ